MNKIKISKIIVFIISFALIICTSTNVFADDNLLDFDEDFSNPSTDGNTTEGEEKKENNTPIENLTPSENNTATGESTNESANSNADTNNNNSSTYEKTDIPYAGPVEDAVMVSAFIIFGIIGIYTFKKLSDYSNL